MRTTVLIASVGFNPASVVLAARALEPRPSRVILLCTKETDPIASILPSQLGVPLCDIVEVPPDPAVEAARDYLVRELSIDASEDPVLDITGATKPLAIAAWLALAQLRPGFRAVYLAPSGKLRDANTGKPLPGEASISLRELLAWKSIAVQSVEWEGPIAAPPERLRPRLAMYAEVFSHFSSVTHSGNALLTRFSPQPASSLASGVQAAG